MICTGITYYDTTNIGILVQYHSSDGNKGLYTSNDPYTLQDIYDTDIANNWGFVEKVNNSYYSTAFIRIQGNNTYFQSTGETLEINNLYVYNFWCNFPQLINIYNSVIKLSNKNRYVHISSKGSIKNSVISGERVYCSFGGRYIVPDDKLIVDGLLFNKPFSIYSNENVDFKNMTIHNATYPIVPNNNTTYENIILIEPHTALYTQRLSSNSEVTIRNCKFIDITSRSVLFSFSNDYNILLNVIDGTLDWTEYQLYLGSGDMIINYKTTFNAVIGNGSGSTLILYDKDDNILYDEVLVSENMTEQEITYVNHDVAMDDSVVTKDELSVLHPFKLIISKNGYENLIISNIYVTPGQPTIIRGTLLEPNSRIKIHNSTIYNSNLN
jgi:hypothetical protein